jgi:hypothetical protein
MYGAQYGSKGKEKEEITRGSQATSQTPPVLRCPSPPRWRNVGDKHIDGPDCAIPVGSDTVVPRLNVTLCNYAPRAVSRDIPSIRSRREAIAPTKSPQAGDIRLPPHFLLGYK